MKYLIFFKKIKNVLNVFFYFLGFTFVFSACKDVVRVGIEIQEGSSTFLQTRYIVKQKKNILGTCYRKKSYFQIKTFWVKSGSYSNKIVRGKNITLPKKNAFLICIGKSKNPKNFLFFPLKQTKNQWFHFFPTFLSKRISFSFLMGSWSAYLQGDSVTFYKTPLKKTFLKAWKPMIEKHGLEILRFFPKSLWPSHWKVTQAKLEKIDIQGRYSGSFSKKTFYFDYLPKKMLTFRLTVKEK